MSLTCCRLVPLLGLAVAGGLMSGCGDSSGPDDPEPYPVAWSWTEPARRTVDLRYLLPISSPDCSLDSVTVTGPGLSTALTMDCTGDRGVAFAATLDLTTLSPPLPLVYTFRATIDGRTTQQVAEVNCHQTVPTGLAPAHGATVASPVTLQWALGTGTGVDYTAAVFLGGVKQAGATVRDGNSLVLTLAPGSYQWTVSAAPKGLYDGTAERHCGASWELGAFTVE